jgi:hypothetical protein
MANGVGRRLLLARHALPWPSFFAGGAVAK